MASHAPDILAQKAAHRRARVEGVIHRNRDQMMKPRDPNQERARRSILSRINRGDK